MRKTHYLRVLLLALAFLIPSQFVATILNAQSTQAEWIRYTAISPDGKTIAFSYMGDIYTADALTGGNAKAITANTSYDFKPVWSNKSDKLAFASDRYGNFDVFVVDAKGGIPTRLTHHSAAQTPNSFTPDDSEVLFSASIMDLASNVQFPSGTLTELYKVSVNGGRVHQILSVPALDAKYTKDGSKILYYDRKGYENDWRKHHTSSVTRDIWVYDVKNGMHTQLSTFAGENREPVFGANEDTYYFLNEASGSFNVVKSSLSNPAEQVQLTNFELHPVRFLSIANNGTLAFTYNGFAYTMKEGMEPKKLAISVIRDRTENAIERKVMSSGASEMAVSSNGKEVAFIVRGEVFVTSVEYGTTKRITDTPEQERSVSFSPDGKKLLYAAERNNSWNLYEAMLSNPEEKYFHQATLITEKALLITDKETFQPAYSPDGKEVAFLEERVALRVINLDSKKVRTVMPSKYSYSYSDGDQYYMWSPDGKWFLVNYFEEGGWNYTDAGLVAADGKSDPINLSKSGYTDAMPKWMMGGKVMIWASDRNGLRSHGSWGADSDMYAAFFDPETYADFKLSKEEAEYKKELEDAAKKDEEKDDKDSDKKKKDDDKKEETKPDLKLELDGLEDRIERLTIHSSNLSDAVLTPDGTKLYYLARFEGGYDLWMNDLREEKTELVLKLSGYSGSLTIDEDGKNLYLISGGQLTKIETDGNKKKTISFAAEMNLNRAAERTYMFEHAWRQVVKKFYVEDLHGAAWDKLRADYAKKLPHISNNYDFAEMLSELLGELNASHTGSGYRANLGGDETANLGAFFDEKYSGNGLLIKEIVAKTPMASADVNIKNGYIIESIDGETILPNTNWFGMLNHKTGKKVLLGLSDPKSGKKWTETIKPISNGAFNNLLYERWVESRRAEVEKLSNGRIGYVHVRGMNSPSFREVYSEVFGRHRNKEALVVDTRFNGGGWLHDDLATLLNGVDYAQFVPRGQYVGKEPMNKWSKPSVVVMSESNYSDAHGFPFAYKALNIGKLVGMPVPGTMTAVWWETLIDPTIYFGIPQVGVADMDGVLQENTELMPDVMVPQTKSLVVQGRDEQIEAAVKVLLEELDE